MLTDRANTICLYKILEKYSDDEHILPMKKIMDYFMDDYGLKVDRRTVYSSVDTLKELGYDISGYDENKHGYYLRSRLFEPSEIHLLTDAVYSLRSVPKKQTGDLVNRLQSVLSIYHRNSFKHLFSANVEKKTENHFAFYNIAILDDAITKHRKTAFIYMQYGLNKRLKPRKEEKYIVNPYGMVCDNQRYYLICLKEGKDEISYYRIDLMRDIEILDEKIDKKPSEADLASTRKVVYAFAGQPENIVLRCDNAIIGGFIDRFGTEPQITRYDENTFIAKIYAVPQGVLYWTMQYLDQIEIIAPENLRQTAIKMLKSNRYGV